MGNKTTNAERGVVLYQIEFGALQSSRHHFYKPTEAEEEEEEEDVL
jgi:hypothetical protein